MSAAVARSLRAEAALRLLGAALSAWLFVSAAVGTPALPGVSTFGRPPELAIVWLLAGSAAAWWLLRAPERASLARRLTLVLLVSTVLGQRGVPGDGGCRLLLLATALLAARPWLVAGRAALLTAAALLLALPAMLGTDFPQGSILWLSYVLPPAALALLVPSLFMGRHAGRIVLVLVLATATLCTFALASYAQLGDGLQLPLTAVVATRLRLLGLHPNLAVPHLVTTLLLAAGLACTLPPRMRALLALAALPVLGALLAVRSRTGLLAMCLGGALLGWQLLLPRLQARLPLLRWAPTVAAIGVALLLLWPALDLGERPSLSRDPSMVSKAVSFRASMWELGRAAWAAAPWHGYGPGTTHVQGLFARPGVYEGLPKDDHPHSVVLAVGEALGWPGIIGLALLFGASIVGARRAHPAVHAAGAALLALWAANAIDLGGADFTLYPALVFLLLGLREAAASELSEATVVSHVSRSTRPDHATLPACVTGPRPTRTALVVPWIATGCALLGGAAALGEACERKAIAAITAAEAARRPIVDELPSAFPTGTDSDAAAAVTARDVETLEWLDRAERLQPFDPNPPLLRARFASLHARPTQALEALQSARSLFPGSATLAHQAALVLSSTSPDDPRVDSWLVEAVRLDPYGPESWRRHLDRARLSARRGRADDAFASLLAAVLLNPSAVADMPRSGDGENIVLYPAGLSRTGVSVARLLQALAERRALAQAAAPEEAARLRLRGVEVLQAIGQLQAADALALSLLADNELYLQMRTAQSCVADGRYDEAVERYQSIIRFEIFSTRCYLLDAMSRMTPLDADAFAAQLAVAFQRMEQDIDVVFELDSVQRLLRARQRCAERSGDLHLAVRLADALAFSQR